MAARAAFRGSLLASLLCATAGLPAAAQEICMRNAWSFNTRLELFAGHVPIFESGESLPKEGIFALTLDPDTAGRTAVTANALAARSYRGTVSFEALAAGRYRIGLSAPARVEASQDRLPLAVSVLNDNGHCPGIRQTVELVTGYGQLNLWISGATERVLRLAVFMVAP